MRTRKMLLMLFVVLLGGLIRPGRGAATGGAATHAAAVSAIDSPKKLCGWPPPAGVSLAEWENACDALHVDPDDARRRRPTASTMTTHSCDGHYEFQIHVVPGKKSAPGAMRPIMKGGGLGADRPPEKKVGEIPEVEQTLTRYDAAYPFMNEKQVIIGETTIGGRRELFNDEGLFDIMELERVALERASTAREAIKIMGEFATKYGYGDSGECLTVGDPNEVWQFEIFGAGPARRAPCGPRSGSRTAHVGVSANRSRIPTARPEEPGRLHGLRRACTRSPRRWGGGRKASRSFSTRRMPAPPRIRQHAARVARA